MYVVVFSAKCLSVSLKVKKEWRSNIYNSSKGLSSKLDQEAFELEKYSDFLPYRDSIIFYRFRTGNQILQIETDRWLV